MDVFAGTIRLINGHNGGGIDSLSDLPSLFRIVAF